MSENLTFDDLGLTEEILEACRQLGWIKPTAIQAASIPHALRGKNIVALAETGSGKTAAYALPIVQNLLKETHSYYAIILAPTRELAFQVQAQFNAIGKAIGLVTALLVGGIPISQQATQMRLTPPHILIATPGRFADHLKKTKGFDELKFAQLRFLVIDEADRMLGSDFESAIERIMTMLPRERQTFLFSATMTEKVGKLQRASVRDPVRISTRKSKFQTVENLRQYVHLIAQSELDTYLVYFLRVAFSSCVSAPGLDMIRLQSNEGSDIDDCTDKKPVMPTSVIVFTRTREASNRLNLLLRQFLCQPVIALNGDMPQAQRLGALHKFKHTQGAVLVATDVASRGLDIPQVGLVINYDVPLDAKTYMHRVGRTARAGRAGCALTLLTQYSVLFFLKEIESHLLSFAAQQSKIPALIDPRSEEDLALEAVVAQLDTEVKLASARATQAVGSMRKRSGTSAKNASSGGFTAVTDMATPSATDLPTKTGFKHTAWASEAPKSKRQEIVEVMSVLSAEQTTASDGTSHLEERDRAKQSAIRMSRKAIKRQKQSLSTGSTKPKKIHPRHNSKQTTNKHRKVAH